MGKRTHGPHLLHAIETNDHGKVHEILAVQVRSKVKIRELCISDVKRLASEHFDCPLMVAASVPDPSIIKYIVAKHGVDINFVYKQGSGKRVKTSTPLIHAVRRGLFPTVDVLLGLNVDANFQDHKGRSALHHAVKKANYKMSKMLLSRGANANVMDNGNNTPLHIATKYGHIELAKLLLQYNADMYKRGHFGGLPIHIAAKEGHIALVQLYCAREVSVNTKVPCYTDMREKSPLHVAAEEGHKEMVLALIDEFGAEINMPDSEGETALHCTVINEYDPHGMKSKDDHVDTAKIIIQAGADVNLRNGRGETPLHLSARNEFQKVVELLIVAGADPLIEDNDKNKAINLVSEDDTVSLQALKRAVTDREKYVNQLLESRSRGLSGSMQSMPGRMMGSSMGSMQSLNYGGQPLNLNSRTLSNPMLFTPQPGGEPMIYQDGYLRAMTPRDRLASSGSIIEDPMDPFNRNVRGGSMRAFPLHDPMQFDRFQRAGSMRSLSSMSGYQQIPGQMPGYQQIPGQLPGSSNSSLIYARMEDPYSRLDSDVASLASESTVASGMNEQQVRQVRQKTRSELNRLSGRSHGDIDSDSSAYDDIPQDHQRIMSYRQAQMKEDVINSHAQMQQEASAQGQPAIYQTGQGHMQMNNQGIYGAPNATELSMNDSTPTNTLSMSSFRERPPSFEMETPKAPSFAPIARIDTETELTEDEAVYQNMPSDDPKFVAPPPATQMQHEPSAAPEPATPPMLKPLSKPELPTTSPPAVKPRPKPKPFLGSAVQQRQQQITEQIKQAQEKRNSFGYANPSKKVAVHASDKPGTPNKYQNNSPPQNTTPPKTSPPYAIAPKKSPQITFKYSPKQTLTITPSNEPKSPSGMNEEWRQLPEQMINSQNNQNNQNNQSNPYDSDDTFFDDASFDTMSDSEILDTPEQKAKSKPPYVVTSEPQADKKVEDPKFKTWITEQAKFITQRQSSQEDSLPAAPLSPPPTAAPPPIPSMPPPPLTPTTDLSPTLLPSPTNLFPTIPIKTVSPTPEAQDENSNIVEEKKKKKKTKTKTGDGEEKEKKKKKKKAVTKEETVVKPVVTEKPQISAVAPGSPLVKPTLKPKPSPKLAPKPAARVAPAGEPQPTAPPSNFQLPALSSAPQPAAPSRASQLPAPSRAPQPAVRPSVLNTVPVAAEVVTPLSPGRLSLTSPARSSVSSNSEHYWSHEESSTLRKTKQKSKSESEYIDMGSPSKSAEQQEQPSENRNRTPDGDSSPEQYTDNSARSDLGTKLLKEYNSFKANQRESGSESEIKTAAPEQPSNGHVPSPYQISNIPDSTSSTPRSSRNSDYGSPLYHGRPLSQSSSLSRSSDPPSHPPPGIPQNPPPIEHKEAIYQELSTDSPGEDQVTPTHGKRKVTIGVDVIIPRQRRSSRESEQRTISFDSHSKVRISVVGGNAEGMFIHRIDPGSDADQQGLLEGDQIMAIQEQPTLGKTKEDVVYQLMSLPRRVDLVVRYKRERYERVANHGGMGDRFFVKACFNHKASQQTELTITEGDVFSIRDTLPDGQMGSWQALKINARPNETQHGLIPNQARAEQLALAAKTGFKDERGGFIRKSLRRSKSKDALNKSTEALNKSMSTEGIVAYEFVEQRPPSFIRPVVLVGLFSDTVRDRLAMDAPDFFTVPPPEVEIPNTPENSTQIPVNMPMIESIIYQNRHCLMIVSPRAIQFLLSTPMHPIVIYLNPGSKSVIKKLRLELAPNFERKSSFMYEEAVQFEKQFSKLFTASVKYTTDGSWFNLLKDTIGRIQNQPLWEVMPRLKVLEDNYEADQPSQQDRLQGVPRSGPPPNTEASPIPDPIMNMINKHGGDVSMDDSVFLDTSMSQPPNTPLTYDGYFLSDDGNEDSLQGANAPHNMSVQSMNVPVNKYVINNAANRSLDTIHMDAPKPKSILKRGSQSSMLDSNSSPPQPTSFRQRSGSASDLLDPANQNGFHPAMAPRQGGTYPRPRGGPPSSSPPHAPNGNVPASHQRPPVAGRAQRKQSNHQSVETDL